MDQAQNLRDRIKNSRPLRVISIASGKGGVGKSTLAVNLAIALSRMGQKVLIFDADFGLSNIDVMFGISAKYNISHFLSGKCSIYDTMQTGYEDVKFISGGSGVFELLNIGEHGVNQLISGLFEMPSEGIHFDYILCDVGAGINDNIIRVILASSETIVVTTTEPTAILDAYALVKTIMKRDNSHPLHLLINKCETKKEAQRVSEGFTEVIGRHLGKNINPLGLIMYDHNVPLSIKRQVPITVSDPECGTSQAIDQISRTLIDMPVEKETENLLSRLFYRILGDRRG